jgi:hypothetical protein
MRVPAPGALWRASRASSASTPSASPRSPLPGSNRVRRCRHRRSRRARARSFARPGRSPPTPGDVREGFGYEVVGDRLHAGGRALVGKPGEVDRQRGPVRERLQAPLPGRARSRPLASEQRVARPAAAHSSLKGILSWHGKRASARRVRRLRGGWVASAVDYDAAPFEGGSEMPRGLIRRDRRPGQGAVQADRGSVPPALAACR